MLHEDITCPYCRIQFGGYKIFQNKLIHLDILWSYDSGLQRDCEQEDYIKSNIESIDDKGNPKFNDDFKNKLLELRNKFETNPDDITKDNFSFDAFFISFVDCMNYGLVDNPDENEEYNRENMTDEKLEKLYNDGVNLKDALRSFIVKK